MRRAARIDANHVAIVDALRAVGASVQTLSAKGVPDLLVGWRGRNLLFEVKDSAKIPSQQRLTPDQQVWHAAWRGQVTVVNSIDSALKALG